MATDLRTSPEPSVTALVSGIVHDVQELTKQQLALFKHEMASDLRTTKEIAFSSGIGATSLLVGGVLLCLMLVYLLNWATVIPLWGCYGLVGGGVVLVGAFLLYSSKKKLETFNPLPDESVKELKENVQCLMNPK